MPVLQPESEEQSWGRGRGKVGLDAWVGPGCVLFMVDRRGT